MTETMLSSSAAKGAVATGIRGMIGPSLLAAYVEFLHVVNCTPCSTCDSTLVTTLGT